jgi:hypothetical protein
MHGSKVEQLKNMKVILDEELHLPSKELAEHWLSQPVLLQQLSFQIASTQSCQFELLVFTRELSSWLIMSLF